MNYLAHLFLSGEKAEIMAGNFLADFIKPKDISELSDEMQEGIRIHYFIDQFTDSHKAVKKSVRILRKTQGKYAPVAHDILMDYLLYYNWSQYSNQQFDQFCQYCYIVLERFLPKFPDERKEQVQRMIEARWLSSYTSLEGLQNTMLRMDIRTRFPSKFFTAVDHFKEEFNQFNTLFNEFFPDLMKELKKETNPQSEV